MMVIDSLLFLEPRVKRAVAVWPLSIRWI